MIAEYDFIIDGADNFPTKFLINDACVLGHKPFCHAGILRFEGQLMTYVPDVSLCYRCIFEAPPPKDAVPSCREAGVIGAMAGIIGSMQALEAVKYITGQGELLTGSMLVFDGLKMNWRKVRLPERNHNCPICGDNPTITVLADEEQKACLKALLPLMGAFSAQAERRSLQRLLSSVGIFGQRASYLLYP
jgi:molybdopterin/thiamine biosynthesis adenylyltransferase